MKKWKVKFIIGGITGETIVTATTADMAKAMVKQQYAMVKKDAAIVSCVAV